jgi:hypothetical protein
VVHRGQYALKITHVLVSQVLGFHQQRHFGRSVRNAVAGIQNQLVALTEVPRYRFAADGLAD